MKTNRGNNDSLLGLPTSPLALPQMKTTKRFVALGFFGVLLTGGAWLTVVGVVVYVAWHFISKFW